MVAEDTKQRIEAMTIDEMAYEINRGRRSIYQNDNFAHLKTRYEARLREINTVQNSTTKPSDHEPPNTHHTNHIWQRPIGAIWIIVIGGLILASAIFLIRHYVGIPL
jgi:hypothetical protein